MKGVNRMKEWEKDVLQGKVLPNLYRAREYLKRNQYDRAYEEIEEAIAVIANKLLPELDLIDLHNIEVFAWIDRKDLPLGGGEG